MRNNFIHALTELAADDPRVWLLTADLGYSVLETFAQRYPKRYVNVGVAEQNMTGIATGLALSGKIVFTYSIANFPTFRCLEQIRTDACYHHANVKVVSVGGGFAYGAQGYTHHGVEDLSVMRSLPNMTIFAPGDPLETRQAVQGAIDTDGPCYLRLGKGGEPMVHDALPAFTVGKAILVRPGTDLTIISTGAMLKPAVDTADALQQEGVSIRVLSMPTLKPLDVEAILEAARETGAVITTEEHSVTGGLGSAVAEVLAEAGIACCFRRHGVPDRPYHAIGSQSYLRRTVMGDLTQFVRSSLNAV